jgi:hypothetical protein
MPEVRTKIPAAELKPGQFFLTNDRWYRATSAPTLRDNAAPLIRATSPINGATVSMWLNAEQVTVNEGNTIPNAFRAATLRRKSAAARQQAAELIATADRLDLLTVEMQHEADAIHA